MPVVGALCMAVTAVALVCPLSEPERALPVQSLGAMAPQQIAALAQQQQLQNLTQQLQSQLSLQNMNLSFFNQVTCDAGASRSPSQG